MAYKLFKGQKYWIGIQKWPLQVQYTFIVKLLKKLGIEEQINLSYHYLST